MMWCFRALLGLVLESKSVWRQLLVLNCVYRRVQNVPVQQVAELGTRGSQPKIAVVAVLHLYAYVEVSPRDGLVSRHLPRQPGNRRRLADIRHMVSGHHTVKYKNVTCRWM